MTTTYNVRRDGSDWPLLTDDNGNSVRISNADKLAIIAAIRTFCMEVGRPADLGVIRSYLFSYGALAPKALLNTGLEWQFACTERALREVCEPVWVLKGVKYTPARTLHNSHFLTNKVKGGLTEKMVGQMLWIAKSWLEGYEQFALTYGYSQGTWKALCKRGLLERDGNEGWITPLGEEFCGDPDVVAWCLKVSAHEDTTELKDKILRRMVS